MKKEDKTKTQLLAEIKESEKIFRDLAEQSPCMIFINRGGEIVYVNRRCEEHMGYSKEEFYATDFNWHSLIAPEDRHIMMENFKKHMNGQEVPPVDYSLITKEGRKIEAILSTKLITYEGERAILGTITDITERKLIEEALRKSEERFKMLFVNAPLAYQSLDEMGSILDVNQEWLNTLGYSKEEVIDHHFTEFISPDNVNSFENNYPLFKKNNKVEEIKFEMVRKDGKKIIVSFFGNIQRDAKGVFRRTHCIFQDITEQKRIEEQLLQAQKMESVGQLAGGVAHDFNNLLTAIIGYGNLLKNEIYRDDLLLSYVTQILNSAERAADLTHSLLAFSRRQMIKPKPVNVNNIINNMKSFLPRIIGEDIELSVFPADQDLRIMADSSQIEQVLMNLATNARDAMPEGGSIIIRTELRELDSRFLKTLLNIYEGSRPGPYALISVEDTGQGMDKETRERLFDPFFTTKDVGKGTGLGLSIAYGIIKQHNGYIDVHSELGKGTTFNLYFPLTEQTFEELQAPEELPILRGGNETVLVAEDETYVRDFIKEILTGYGYNVMESVDGDDAIRMFNKHRESIQLLILDVVMPKKDGRLVYQEIKKVSPDTKFIFVSGYATDILYKKGIIEEGINFISKPMSPHELLTKVREVLDH